MRLFGLSFLLYIIKLSDGQGRITDIYESLTDAHSTIAHPDSCSPTIAHMTVAHLTVAHPTVAHYDNCSPDS